MLAFVLTAAVASRRAVLAYTDYGSPFRFQIGEFLCTDREYARAAVIDALNEIHSHVKGLAFVEGGGGVVYQGIDCNGCHVWGYSSVNNKVEIGGCVNDKAAIIHETLHKLGFQHEQFHPDAKKFLVVNETMLPEFWRDQWTEPSEITLLKDFDICSIMMYPAESSNWPKDAVRYTAEGLAALAKCDNQYLSKSDIRTLNHIYKDDHHHHSYTAFPIVGFLIIMVAVVLFLIA